MAVVRRILRGLAWGTVGLLLGAFLVGYAAPYLPPAQFWWTDLFALLVPPLSVGIGVLGVGLLGDGAYRGAWGRVVGAGVLFGLLAVRFGLPSVTGSAAGEEAEFLRVMTFNVPPSQAQAPGVAARLGRLMRREAPDVLALQESWIKTGPAAQSGLVGASESAQVLLADSLRYAPPQTRPPQSTIYQPVLGRVPLDSVSVHALPPDGDSNPRSRYTRTVFRWHGRPVVLYNVHLHTVGAHPRDLRTAGWAVERWRALLRTYRRGALRRAEQARLLRRRIEHETRPVIVVGDFNSTPHQWAYRHLAAGLQGAGGWGQDGTFPAEWPVVRIDHVLAGPAWTVATTRVPASIGAASISDHRPVVAQLRWRGD